MRKADRVLGLGKMVAGCFSDARDPNRIQHACQTLIAQRVHGLALDYEDLNDHDDLHHDPVLGLLSERQAPPGRGDVAALAGKSTLNRLEHTVGNDSRYHKFTLDEAAMEQVFVRLYLAVFKSPPKRIILAILMPPMIRCMVNRKAAFSMAIIAAIVTFRFIFLPAVISCVPSSRCLSYRLAAA